MARYVEVGIAFVWGYHARAWAPWLARKSYEAGYWLADWLMRRG